MDTVRDGYTHTVVITVLKLYTPFLSVSAVAVTIITQPPLYSTNTGEALPPKCTLPWKISYVADKAA